MNFSQIRKVIIDQGEAIKIKIDSTIVWTKSKLLKSIVGNSIQNGDPTPDAPVEVQSVGERTANLFDISTSSYEKGIYINATTGLENSSSTYYCSDYIPVVAGQTYTHTVTGLTANWIYDIDKKPLTKVVTSTTSGTITVPERGCYLRFNVKNTLSPNSLMCNAGDTLLDYESYGYSIPVQVNGKTAVIYVREPLRKVGDYADEISQAGIVRRVIEWQLDGVTAGHKLYSSGYSSTYYRGTLSNLRAYTPNLKPLSSARSVLSSDQYQYLKSGNALSTAFLNNSEGSGQLYIVHSDQTLTTTDALNERLAVDKPIFYFPIEDTLDTNFSWEQDIEVPYGATITFGTAVQPSDYILE